MAVGSPPTVRRRQLGRELRRLREEAGLHADQLAGRLRCSPSRISRIETARIRISPGTVHEILDVLGINGAERGRLVELARDAEQSGWWQAYAEVLSAELSSYVALESAASVIRSFEPLVIHGLLQTDDYARALLARLPDSGDVEAKLRARAKRRERLTGPDAVSLWFIFDEAVAQRQVGGPQVMGSQLRFLIECGQLPNVRMQVLPFTLGAHANLTGPFGLITFPDPEDTGVVYLESGAGQGYVERASVVREYEHIFERLGREALPHDETLSFVAQLIHPLSR